MNEMTLDSYKNDAIVLDKRVGKLVPNRAPVFSVIIPVYNLAEFIVETLDSVFAQTFTDYEVILVNDGSPDTPELEEKLALYREKLVYLKQENCGAAMARNTAILQARGKFLAFLDGDDVWFPDYLEKQLAFVEKNGLELAYCNALYFGEKYYKVKTYMEQSRSFGKVTAEKLIRAEINFLTSATIVLREKLLENGLFDKDFRRNEDFDLWFRLVKNGLKTDYQTEVLLKYRVRIGSWSGNLVQRTERILLGYQKIGAKYDLTDSEKKALAERILVMKYLLLLAKGKSCLVNQQFGEAQTNFKKANQIHFTSKLTAIIFLLKVSPTMVLRLFSQMRPNEMTLIKSWMFLNACLVNFV